MDAIRLSIFSNRIEAICEEMGATLRRAAFSPNIRDRLDFSCAVFDQTGELCAQAAHIPVHLGSMAFAMRGIVNRFQWRAGDMVVLNDPYQGGTHLPDVSLIAPVFVQEKLIGFVVNRAHHADIGSESPGSMPISSSLSEEGLVISPKKLISGGVMNNTVMDEIMRALRNPDESRGDFNAQIAANHRGAARLLELVHGLGATAYRESLQSLNAYADGLARASLADVPDGVYTFDDVLDDDGLGHSDIAISVNITVAHSDIRVDFTGTSPQVVGNVNCPLSVTAAAVYYVFRCLLPAQTPACAGAFRAIQISAPEGSVLNARPPAAVAAGNVETSTRVVDVVLGALARALPEKVPAASHGSMNNIAMGSSGKDGAPAWNYYETIGGGMGGHAEGNGLDGVQTHMTNTLNTPIEALEMYYPLRIRQYAFRDDSGGLGRYRGGNGIVREYSFLGPAQFTLLTERRTHAPWGLMSGAAAKAGVNTFNGKTVAGKVSLHANSGDVLRIETPGGGGWGKGQVARHEG